MAGDFYFRNWAELFFFVLLVIGFFLSLLAPSAVISYLMIFVLGMMSGRLIYERKQKLQFPYYLIVVGLLIGYLLGAYYGNKRIILTLFILGMITSYFLHNRGIIHDLRY